MPKRLLAVLTAVLLLSACAQQLPPAPTTTVSTQAQLLQSLAHCGAASSYACARIHLDLARHYLQAQPLTPNAIAAARSELAMAAQNPEMAQEVQPWRNLVASWQPSAQPPHSCPNDAANNTLAAQIAHLKAENTAQKQQLDRLNSLLQSEAQKSLQGKPH
ncbi:MAG: hypothetical protein U7M05_04735 [Candidatus Igneacidithiobacillus chanchocoensis]